MSDRERWTIYPLLFLALALGLRDRLFPPPPPATMTLRELTILGEDNRANIRLRGADNQGASPSIQILNRQGKPGWLAAVVAKTGVGFEETGAVYAREVRVLGPDGKSRVAIGVSQKPDAGSIEWFDDKGKRLLVAGGGLADGGAITSFRNAVEQFSFGSNERGTVLVARNPDGKPYFFLVCDENGTGRGLMFDREGNGQLLVGQPVAVNLNEIQKNEPATDEKPAEKAAEENPQPPKESPPEPSTEQPAKPERSTDKSNDDAPEA